MEGSGGKLSKNMLFFYFKKFSLVTYFSVLSFIKKGNRKLEKWISA